MNRISGKLHADSLLKRGRDFIPVAILVTALFALFGTVDVVCGVHLEPSRRRSNSGVRLCSHGRRRGDLACGRRGPDGTGLL